MFIANKNNVDIIGLKNAFQWSTHTILQDFQISLLALLKSVLIIAEVVNIHWVFTVSFYNVPTGAINSSCCFFFSSSVIYYSFAIPWTIAHQASLSMGLPR